MRKPVLAALILAVVAVLVALWAVRIVVDWQFSWKKDPVALCLGGLFLLGIWQLVPLPKPILATLSPATVRLYDDLLPAHAETLPLGAARGTPERAAGTSLSVYPYGTHTELIRLLAVFLVYAVVRNNCASAAALRRLSVALTINGTLLAFLAIVQFFTSPHGTIYWSIETPGAPFGPFPSRTHFPAYVNVCIGSAIGLLLSLQSTAPEQRDRPWDPRGALAGLLADPRKLWLGCAVALMVASVLLSLSRGGFLALAGGTVVFLLLGPARALRRQWIGPALVAATAAVALVGWLGLTQVEARLQTIWKGDALAQSRLPLWLDVWPLVLEFPLLGTGLGTFRYVQPLHQERIGSAFFADHAHNEFLEAFIEGGVVRLAISLLMIGLVFRWGYRAVGNRAGTATGGLALGALFGFVTLVIHSIGDFGIHLPAIALLAAVLCAQLVGLGKSDDAYRFRLGGVGPIVGAAAALLLALTLAGNGLRMFEVQRFRSETRALEGQDDPESTKRRFDFLEAAVALAPDDAELHVEAGDAHDAVRRTELAGMDRGRAATYVTLLVLAAAPSGAAAPLTPASLAAVELSAVTAWDTSAAGDLERVVRAHMIPALRHYLWARDLCPLMYRAQQRLAGTAATFENADSLLSYVDRTKRLAPNDPQVWFAAGVQEFVLGDKDKACQSWRRSLELSDRYLGGILELGRTGLTTQDFLERILPDQPKILVTAAIYLYPQDADAAQRRPFLDKALDLLKAEAEPRKADSWFLQAQVHRSVGQNAEAQAAYRQALTLEPRRDEWRLQYAHFLYTTRQWKESRRELARILDRDPANSQAQLLLAAVERELLEAGVIVWLPQLASRERQRPEDRTGTASGR